MKRIDLLGQRFVRLTVISDLGKDSRGESLWGCVCDCGKESNVRGSHLRKGAVVSCGCYGKEAARKRLIQHGMAETSIFRAWSAMIQRCTNDRTKSFANYGGRGIKVCERWASSFKSFIEDMGERPNGASIDRIDTNGNYEPANCRWATPKEQQRNKRNNRKVTLYGMEVTLAEAVEQLKVKRWRVYYLAKTQHKSIQDVVLSLAK